MEIKKYHLLPKDEAEKYREKMNGCDWDAGRYLAYSLEDEKFFSFFGKDSEALLLTENDELLAFCTFAEIDEIDDESMKPWIGFVYTFPEHRGHRYSGVLIDYAKKLAHEKNNGKIYVSSEEKGLYEKYGFTFLKDAMSIHGYETQIFVFDMKNYVKAK